MKKILVAATVALAMGTGVASADIVTIDQIIDGWDESSVVGGSAVSVVNQANPGGVDTVSWGTTSGAQSSYVWDSTDVEFDVDTDDNGGLFSLGQFTHNNNVIGAGSSITAVVLDFAFGTFESPETLSVEFNFAHNETSNQSPCGFTSTSVCDDFVTITNAPLNQVITYGGVNYFFSLKGFSTDGGDSFTNIFQTQENQANHAQLYATITTTAVPDGGATLALLGGALVGLGALRRRMGI